MIIFFFGHAGKMKLIFQMFVIVINRSMRNIPLVNNDINLNF